MVSDNNSLHFVFGANHVCPCWKWIFQFTSCSFVCHVKISLCWHLSSILSNDRWIWTRIFNSLHFRSTLKQLGVIFLNKAESVHEWIQMSHYHWYLVGGLIGLITDLSFFWHWLSPQYFSKPCIVLRVNKCLQIWKWFLFWVKTSHRDFFSLSFTE